MKILQKHSVVAVLCFPSSRPLAAKSPCLVSCDLGWHCGILPPATSLGTGAGGRWCSLLQAPSGARGCLNCVPFPSQAACGDPPLPSSAGGEALPAAQRVKSAFRRHLKPPPLADTRCSEQPCAGGRGRSTHLGFTCWGESLQIPQARPGLPQLRALRFDQEQG